MVDIIVKRATRKLPLRAIIFTHGFGWLSHRAHGIIFPLLDIKINRPKGNELTS